MIKPLKDFVSSDTEVHPALAAEYLDALISRLIDGVVVSIVLLATLLLVEDDLSVRRAGSIALRTLDCTVFEAASGPEALKAWDKHHDRIALLFTDVVMPRGMNGLELAKKLRACKPSLRVVISSGYNVRLSKPTRLSESGFVSLPKPYDSFTLARAVRACLDRTVEPGNNPNS